MLGCLNIRSICNKTVTVNDVLSDHKLDVLALTETWLEESADTCLAAIILPGGSIVEQVRPVSRNTAISDSFVNHGGIVCLARSGIKMAKFNFSHKPVPFEVLCVRLRSGNSTSTSVLYIICRPGFKPSNAKFSSELSEHLESLATDLRPVYLTADLNIHVNDSSDKFTIELCRGTVVSRGQNKTSSRYKSNLLHTCHFKANLLLHQ